MDLVFPPLFISSGGNLKIVFALVGSFELFLPWYGFVGNSWVNVFPPSLPPFYKGLDETILLTFPEAEQALLNHPFT